MNPPRARIGEVLRTDLDQEVVIYDPDSKRAHSLNRLAAAVWNHCDGINTIADLGQLVSAETGSPIDEAVIRAALRQLDQAHLLARRLDHAGAKTVGRREMLRKAGQLGAAAVAAPLVASVLVPTAAAAASVTTFATFSGLAFYQPGAPSDLASGGNTGGGFVGGPDTGFLQITNNGPGTFSGTIAFNAVGGNGVDYSDIYGPLTLNPGDHHSYNFNSEQSNQGGYGGPTGSTQNGAEFIMSGQVTLGGVSRPLNFSIFDKDIHSGVFRTNTFGVLLDNYIQQGGDPLGRDTGDTYEDSQAPGPFNFSV